MGKIGENLVRLDRALGRKVLAGNNRRIGRLEEFRARREGNNWVVTEYVIGEIGLLERLLLGARLVIGRRHQQSYVARWDQLDLTTPERPRLTCSVDDLRVED
jgi:hypothetical protein